MQPHMIREFDRRLSGTPPSRAVFSVILAVAVGAGCHCGAQAGEPILIGQTYIGSGPVASFSDEPTLGINALIAAVNRAGGIGGHRIIFKRLDDANSAAKAEANVRELAREGAVAILMPIGTLPATGAMNASNELQIPVIGPYSGARQLYAASSTTYPVRISFSDEATRIVNHMTTIGLTRIAAIRIDNAGAKIPIDAARSALQSRGGDLVSEIVLSQDGADAGAKARQLAELRPQGIVMSVSNAVAATFIKAYRSTGTSAQFYSTSFLNGNVLYRDLGDSANGVVIMQVVPSPGLAIPIAAEFRNSMQAIGAGSTMTYPSFEGYIAAKTLVEALRKSSSFSPIAVQQALQSMNHHDLGGVTISFRNRDQGALNYGELTMVGPKGALIR